MNQELPNFVLPSGLIGTYELAQLIREVETVDADLESQRVRGQSKNGYKLPTMSRSLSDFLELNKIDLVDDQQRMTVKEQLRVLKNKAPVIHMTFAVAADPQSIEQLVAWIRKELHPWALISVGLQPSLVGGVYIRTPNHVHDFSMRALFEGKTDTLTQALEEFSRAAG